MMSLQGDPTINEDVFKAYGAVAIELMKGNMAMRETSDRSLWHPPLWLAFVSGPTGDPTRYNMQPTPQGTTCTP